MKALKKKKSHISERYTKAQICKLGMVPDGKRGEAVEWCLQVCLAGLKQHLIGSEEAKVQYMYSTWTCSLQHCTVPGVDKDLWARGGQDSVSLLAGVLLVALRFHGQQVQFSREPLLSDTLLAQAVAGTRVMRTQPR